MLALVGSPVAGEFWLQASGSLKALAQMGQWTFCHTPMGISLTHTLRLLDQMHVQFKHTL